MPETSPNTWQFSLRGLLLITTVIAAVAGMIKVVGWGVVCMLFHPLLIMIFLGWALERRLRRKR
jgi:hypothetical protein